MLQAQSVQKPAITEHNTLQCKCNNILILDHKTNEKALCWKDEFSSDYWLINMT